MNDDAKLKRIEQKLRDELSTISPSIGDDAIMKQVRTMLTNKDKLHITKCRSMYGDETMQTWLEGVLNNIKHIRQQNAGSIS